MAIIEIMPGIFIEKFIKETSVENTVLTFIGPEHVLQDTLLISL